jgi:c-di-GMP-binding flagellar brake protein YcgR
MIRHALKSIGFSDPIRKENKPLRLERRKYARVSIGVTVSCMSSDSKPWPLAQVKGIVKNVSQTGLKLEAEKEVGSNRLKLAFEDSNKNISEITGRVVFSTKTPSGTYNIGVQLEGLKPAIVQFVSRLVRFHHYTKK